MNSCKQSSCAVCIYVKFDPPKVISYLCTGWFLQPLAGETFVYIVQKEVARSVGMRN